MTAQVLLDTGPLVAFLDRRDAHHGWAREQLAVLPPPLLTCEAVLSESIFLVRRGGGPPEAVLEAVWRGALKVDFAVASDAAALTRLIRKYADVPISLADACLVRMAEREANASVLTVDRDFLRYRKNGRGAIPLIAPW